MGTHNCSCTYNSRQVKKVMFHNAAAALTSTCPLPDIDAALAEQTCTVAAVSAGH